MVKGIFVNVVALSRGRFMILSAVFSFLSAVSWFYQRFSAFYQRFLSFISDSRLFISGFSLLSAILGALSAIFSLLSAVSRFYQRLAFWSIGPLRLHFDFAQIYSCWPKQLIRLLSKAPSRNGNHSPVLSKSHTLVNVNLTPSFHRHNSFSTTSRCTFYNINIVQ